MLTTRKATLHAVGDLQGFISTGVQNVYKAKLTGYNSLTGIYSVIKNGSGNDMQLTLDADACDVAYKALSNYKAGTVGESTKNGRNACYGFNPKLRPAKQAERYRR